MLIERGRQGSVTFEFSTCSTGKVEAAGRGPFLSPTYLGRLKGLCSQGKETVKSNLRDCMQKPETHAKDLWHGPHKIQP